MLLLLSADFFAKLTFSEKSFKNTIRVSYGLDPDQRLCQMWASFYQKMPAIIVSSTGNLCKQLLNNFSKFVALL